MQTMTPSEFAAGIAGEDLLMSDGKRARHVVAVEIKKRANELRGQGRIDIAARLDQFEIRVRDGLRVTKGLRDKLKKEIAVVRFTLVGTREEDEDDEYVVGKVG